MNDDEFKSGLLRSRTHTPDLFIDFHEDESKIAHCASMSCGRSLLPVIKDLDNWSHDEQKGAQHKANKENCNKRRNKTGLLHSHKREKNCHPLFTQPT